MEKAEPFKSGFVALVGRPNVGKSTIINAFVGEPVAIVTPKPETTRDAIRGIMTRSDAQVVFVDTPGMHTPRNLLGKRMVRTAQHALDEADVIVMIIDAARGVCDEDRRVLAIVKQANKPRLCVINKVDRIDKRLSLPLIEDLARENCFADIVPVSATKGANMDVLLNLIIAALPNGPACFPADELTDKSERFMVAERIREKALRFTHEEIPHALAVHVDEFSERKKKDVTYICATLFVERQAHKKILIGAKGSMLKKIGAAARKDIEAFLGKRVYLELWVKVRENWRKDERAIKELYE